MILTHFPEEIRNFYFGTQTIKKLISDFLILTPGSLGLTPRDFNSYGSRRGNDAIMSRGTFANIRLVNKFMDKPGPKTKHWPSGDEVRFILFFRGLKVLQELIDIGNFCQFSR